MLHKHAFIALFFKKNCRFEDRYRLPLGVSVNFQSYSAKLLTEMAYNPNMLGMMQQVGRRCTDAVSGGLGARVARPTGRQRPLLGFCRCWGGESL